MDTDPAKIRGGVTASCGALGSLAYGRGCAKLAREVDCSPRVKHPLGFRYRQERTALRARGHTRPVRVMLTSFLTGIRAREASSPGHSSYLNSVFLTVTATGSIRKRCLAAKTRCVMLTSFLTGIRPVCLNGYWSSRA